MKKLFLVLATNIASSTDDLFALEMLYRYAGPYQDI